MCGICGIYELDGQRPVDRDTLARMCAVISHRGPDDEGFYVEGGLGLGIRRLSIIDLTTGKQPIHNEDRTVWIVFNGEIYNYRELREDLEGRGHCFYTQSDTEAIVHGYEEWGDECVQRLNGMFAFAIWDVRQRRLLLARDRLGIKPLHYTFDGRRLLFGSELKSVLQDESISREVDIRALDDFLTFKYILAPKTIFKSIRKLPAGHRLVCQGGQVSVERYWEVSYRDVPNRSEEEWARGLCKRLRESVRKRLVSDVPLGAFLSGGIDSSTVVGLMSQLAGEPVKTFSLGFEDQSYNELNYARLVAERFGTDHHEFIVRPDTVDLVTSLISYLDEPFADVSIIPTYLVSKLTREHVTVALSGDGGDELFAGYDTYIAERLDRLYRLVPAIGRRVVERAADALPFSAQKKGLVNKVQRFVEGSTLPPEVEHVRWGVYLAPENKATLYSTDLQASLNGYDPLTTIREWFGTADGPDPLSRQLYVDVKTWLVDDILTKVDRMSMACSLEARVPFLDHEVVEFAAAIPSSLKIRRGVRKYILNRAMRDLLPREVLNRREKQGFSIPIKNWFRHELRDLLTDALSPDRVRARGYFAPAVVGRMVGEHLKGERDHSHRLWALVVFELWCQDMLM